MSSEEKPTVELAKAPDWAIKLTEKVVGVGNAVGRLADEVSQMGLDVKDLRAADRRHEDDIRRLSERTKDTNASASSSSLEHEAKLGRVLAELAEEKAKTASLEKNGATKNDVKTMLDEASKEQTGAIVTAVETLVKTPTAQKLKSAIVPVILVAISIIGIKLTMLLTKLQESPPTTQTTTVQVQNAPIADAGADR
jgi:hypothetical protein